MRDDDRIANIFMSIRGRLARAVQSIVPPREIEDIVQETYLRVCRAGSKTRIQSPQAFMFRTARNLALDHVKRAESRLADSFDQMEEEGMATERQPVDSTVNTACSDEEFVQFCDSVRYLPVQCRRAFVLRKVYGYSQREIAKAMNISESTVEKHIAEGIKRCLNYIEQQDAGLQHNRKPQQGQRR